VNEFGVDRNLWNRHHADSTFNRRNDLHTFQLSIGYWDAYDPHSSSSPSLQCRFVMDSTITSAEAGV